MPLKKPVTVCNQDWSVDQHRLCIFSRLVILDAWDPVGAIDDNGTWTMIGSPEQDRNV